MRIAAPATVSPWVRAVLFALSLWPLVMPSRPAAAETLRVASWHLEELWHEPGKPLHSRPGQATSSVRDTAGFARLHDVGFELQADVIALQSVGSPQAVRRVFPASIYHLIFSKQLSSRFAESPDALDDPTRRSTYTAIVVRRSRLVRVQRVVQIADLAMRGSGADVPSPAGVAAEIIFHDRHLWVLAADLVSGCPMGAADDEGTCTLYRRQVAVLRSWIDERIAAREPYVVAASLHRSLMEGDGSDPTWSRLSGGTLAERLGADPAKPALGKPAPPVPGPTVAETEKIGTRYLEERESTEPGSGTAGEVVEHALSTLKSMIEGKYSSPAPSETAGAAATLSPAGTGEPAAAEEERENDLISGELLVRFPVGSAESPCGAASGSAAPRAVHPGDYLLIDGGLVDADALEGFGVVPLASAPDRTAAAASAETAVAHCPIYVDLKL